MPVAIHLAILDCLGNGVMNDQNTQPPTQPRPQNLPKRMPQRRVYTNDEIRKPATDQRVYEHMTLDNGLPVMLIHDAETRIDAAAMGFSHGSLYDPEDKQGLSHLLEHVRFSFYRHDYVLLCCKIIRTKSRNHIFG